MCSTSSHMADHFHVAKWLTHFRQLTLLLCCCLLALQISSCWTIPYMVNATKGAGERPEGGTAISLTLTRAIASDRQWLHLKRRTSGSSLWFDAKALVCAIVKGKSQFWLFRATSVSLATFVITVTHNGLPQRIPPLCLTGKPKYLCSELCLPVDVRKEEINTIPCLRFAILGGTWKISFLTSPISDP